MNDNAILKISALFSFATFASIVAGIPIKAKLGAIGGPGPINFADGELLSKLHAAEPATVWVDTAALVGPVLGLGAGIGWYLLLNKHSALALYGTLLWYLGMLFIVAQDAMQLAVVSTLPAEYVAASDASKPAIAAMASVLAYIIEVLASVGVISYVGSLLIGVACLRCSLVPKWLGWLCVVASLVATVSSVLAMLLPPMPLFGLGRAIGVQLFVMLWIPAMGVLMYRHAGKA
jgi:hypothetical protein